MLNQGNLEKVRQLNSIAGQRGQTLAQMAISWLLYMGVTSVLIGARNTDQLDDSLGALHQVGFTENEIARIEAVLTIG
jgi:L-glyceraldehyde 3-phosphate reductase